MASHSRKFEPPEADTAVPRPSRPEVTAAVTRGAMRCLRALGYSVLAEVILTSGRRADNKWAEYAEYCDALSFAVAADFPADILPEELGLIVADAYGGAVIREPPETPLSPARRRAMLLRFGALAADRLHAQIDPTAPD